MPKINKKTKKTLNTKKSSNPKKTSNSKKPKKTRKNPYDMIITRESTRISKPSKKILENQMIEQKIIDAKQAARHLKEARDRARKEFAELTDLLSGTKVNSKSDSSDEILAKMMMGNTIQNTLRPLRNPFILER
jgi:hypothetical protein